jgi:hypothetical protein
MGSDCLLNSQLRRVMKALKVLVALSDPIVEVGVMSY